MRPKWPPVEDLKEDYAGTVNLIRIVRRYVAEQNADPPPASRWRSDGSARECADKFGWEKHGPHRRKDH